jgi:hypothetical protein
MTKYGRALRQSEIGYRISFVIGGALVGHSSFLTVAFARILLDTEMYVIAPSPITCLVRRTVRRFFRIQTSDS